MKQIVHQAILMQLIIEMAKNCNMDSRGCFYLFFQKARKGYFEAFKNALEESDFILKCQVFTYEIQNHVPHFGDGSIGYSILSVWLSSV